MKITFTLSIFLLSMLAGLGQPTFGPYPQPGTGGGGGPTNGQTAAQVSTLINDTNVNRIIPVYTAQINTASNNVIATTWGSYTNIVVFTNGPPVAGQAFVIVGTNANGSVIVKGTNWPTGGGTGTGTLFPPNAVGVLTNNGTGTTNWSTSIPNAWVAGLLTTTNLAASQYASFDVNTNLTVKLDGSGWTNITGTNITLDTSVLAPTGNATNYSGTLRTIVGTQIIYGANTNVNLSLAGTNVADVTRTFFVNNATSSVNCNLTFTFTYRTNLSFSAVVSNGWEGTFSMFCPDTNGTVRVFDAGRTH